MIRQTRTASRQIDELLEYYIKAERDQAILNLQEAVHTALDQIEARPASGRPHPPPYPEIAKWGYLWIKVHRYWFGYSTEKGFPILTNVLDETANMPGRVAEEDDLAPQ